MSIYCVVPYVSTKTKNNVTIMYSLCCLCCICSSSVISPECTQFIKGKAHHGWLTSCVTAILILKLQVLLSGDSGRNLLVWGYQTGYRMYWHVWDLNINMNTDFGTVYWNMFVFTF